ncbi:MAG: replication-relaxation family protein [Planctomycetaceae bacterium]|nr:replication-relaxation family protein [Planctomycetaceae bacterium]
MTDPISQSDREFLKQLHELGSSTITHICEAQGVTTTAVRQRLNRLQAAGLVSRETVKTQRGRPHHEYDLTVEGKKLLGNNYTELATILWNQLGQLQDQKLRDEIVKQVVTSLIDRYGQKIDAVTPAERLTQLQLALSEHGFHVEVDARSDHLALMERSCPYHDLAVQDRSICDMEQEVFGRIVGVPLQLTQRCVEGHGCCRFEEVSLKK